MGGYADARSVEGEGSTFWLTVRMQQIAPPELVHGMETTAQTPALSRDSDTLLQQYTGRVLLVDDNFINREVALELLKSTGLTIDTATDGREALEKVTQNVYDLVLMDVQMPRMDGLEATRAIRQLPNRKDLPIIAMTANAFGSDQMECRESGMNDFIAKPVEPNILYQRLLAWLPEQKITNAIPPPVETKNQDILKELNKLSGLNTAQGLSAVRGNANKYLEVLTAFAHSYQKDVVDLAQLLENGKNNELRVIAHSLKGTAATLGAYRLADWVAQFERLILQPQPDQDNLRSLITVIGQEYNALSAATLACVNYLTTENTAPQALDTQTREALEVVLDELDTLLEQGDTAAIALFENNTDALRTLLGSECEELEQQIRRFGFSQAQTRLHELRQNL